MTEQQPFQTGVKEGLPLALSVATYGLVFGLLGKQMGLAVWELILMSALVFAGAAQFAALPLIGAGLHPFSIALTTYIINLRYYLIAASLLPYWKDEERRDKALWSFFLTDEAYALTIRKYQQRQVSLPYYQGVALSIYLGWVGATALGATFGQFVPDPNRLGLDFAFPAAFLGLIVPQLKSKDKVAVSSAAAVLAVGGALLFPGQWYIVLAGFAGSALGLLFVKEDDFHE